MHGRKREPKGPVDPAKAEARRRKAALYAQLSRAALAARRAGAGGSLEAGAQLLALNPEVYSLWNHRKEAVGPVLAAGGPAAAQAADAELALVQAALLRNPKSYCTWQHRKWVVAHPDCGVDLARELGLCAQLLAADDRNFHCWSYRRYVAALAGRTADQELDFTTEKINENFSNYSAWHYRSALLPRAYPPPVRFGELAGRGGGGSVPGVAGDGAGGAEGGGAPPPPGPGRASGVPGWVLDEEYELVKQAFYTEPADQSAWMYHRWLLGCTLSQPRLGAGGHTAGDARRVLAREAETCRELLEIEPDSKWALLTLARLTQALAQLDPAAGEGGGAGRAVGEAAEMYRRLEALDPDRRGYYGAALQQDCTCLPKPAGGGC